MGLWSKIKKAAKKVGKAIKKGAEAVADAVTTVVNGVVETVESIVSWIGSAASLIVSAILSIPIIGRFINWVFQIVKTIFWRIVGLGDAFLTLIGIMPEKKMRVCVIALKDSKGHFASEAEIMANLDNMITVFKDEANVRVISSAPFNYDTPFRDVKGSDHKWIHFRDSASADDILDVSCDAAAAKEDLLTTGAKFELLSSTMCFYGNWRRLTGYGAPIVIFIVRNFKDGKLGCSLGPLVDYVTASGDGIRRDPLITAHECGHACGLWHLDDNNNLIFPDAGRGSDLRHWQKVILRNSRHVTYF